jgi:translation initiation factor IF-1
VVTRNNKNSKPNHRRRVRKQESRKEDYIYFDFGEIVETMPGVTFKVKVIRKSLDKDKELPPIFIVCNLKAKLIKRRVMMIKGDRVTVEVNPEDMYFNQDENILKGTIIERI